MIRSSKPEHRGCHSRRLLTHLVSASLLAAGLAAAARAEELPVQLLYQEGGDITTCEIFGNRLYMAIGPRLVIEDISDPANPVRLGQSEMLTGLTTDLAVSGNHAYMLTYGAGLTDTWRFGPSRANATWLLSARRVESGDRSFRLLRLRLRLGRPACHRRLGPSQSCPARALRCTVLIVPPNGRVRKSRLGYRWDEPLHHRCF